MPDYRLDINPGVSVQMDCPEAIHAEVQMGPEGFTVVIVTVPEGMALVGTQDEAEATGVVEFAWTEPAP